MSADDRSQAPAQAAAADGPQEPPGPLHEWPHTRATRRVLSRELLAGASELEIAHGASVYRLRLTAMGKLILTK